MVTLEEKYQRLVSADAFSRPLREAAVLREAADTGVLCLVNNFRNHHKYTRKGTIGENVTKAWPSVSFLWQVRVSVGLF